MVRMQRHQRIAACALVVFGLLSLRVASAKNAPRLTLTARVPFRVGVVPYSDPSKSSDPDVLENYLSRYFEAVSKDTRTESASLTVQMVKGSYYQILQWLRDGSLDAAIVSPFSAYLLTNDRNLAAFPLIEFVRPHRDEMHTAAHVRAEKNGVALPDANKRYDECLQEIIRSLSDPSLPETCQIRLVNHLSTTGFVQPLAHAKDFIRRKGLSAERQEEFWTKFLERSQFSIWHNGGESPQKHILTISFDFQANSAGEPLSIFDDPGFFNDVLLVAVRRQTPAPPAANDKDRLAAVVAEERLARERGVPPSLPDGVLGILVSSVDESGQGLNPRSPWVHAASMMTKTPPGKTTAPGYVGIAPWKDDNRQRLAQSINRTFDSATDGAPLRHLYNEWYNKGHYDFTIDELIALFNVDQITRRTPCAAIVLPGGGVRATYQAVILDSLYNRKVENSGPCVGAMSQPGQRLLKITSIAGTSGGALLGALTAHRTTDRSNVLTDSWVEDGSVKTTPSAVFPPLGVFRWLSILLALIVFAGISALQPGSARAQRPRLPMREVPVWFTVALTVIIIFAPSLIWRNTLLNPAYHPAYEGAAFLFILLWAHFFHSASATTRSPLSGKGVIFGIVLSVLGLYAAGVMIAFSTKPEDKKSLWRIGKWWIRKSHGTVFWSVASCAAVIMVISGVVLIARSTGLRLDRSRAGMYRYAFVVLLLLMILTAAFFGVGLVFGEVTVLEMTSAYWVWVLAGALFASRLIVEITRRQHFLTRGFDFLVNPSGTAPFPYTPTLMLVTWGGIGIAVYLIFVAPALYSGEKGRQTFRAALQSCIGHKGMQREPLVPLVVSVTGFGAQVRDFDPYRGDYYAYLDSWKGRMAAVRESLYPLHSPSFDDAVFASGSPFPIYPATSVRLEDKHRPGLFVDGGYAHRVPIDAALATGASQILVIENVARRGADTATKENSRVGALAVNVGKAFEYLFDRSQQVDLERSKSVLVGTIYPDWTEDDPFLMDFREDIVRWLQSQAEADLKRHRVGRIESWGTPLNTVKRHL